jgi:hypothetical protein
MSTLRRHFSVMAVAAWAAAALAAEAATPSQRVALADPALAASDASRLRLKYLASCALDADTVLVGEADGRTYEWAGNLGLAPQWHRRPLTEEEERWVSACILARTNYFGVPVKLSMRSPFPSDAPGLHADADERRAYPVEEATFFGNIFRRDGGAYVCGDNDSAERKAQIAAHRRLCALPLDQRLPDGRRVSACGFVYVGACSAERLVQDGTTYRQAVTVFLPAAPASSEPR